MIDKDFDFGLFHIISGAQQEILFEKNVADCGAMIQTATPWCSESQAPGRGWSGWRPETSTALMCSSDGTWTMR